MHLRVLVFAGLRERLRRDSVDVELAAGATVRDLLAAVARDQPDLSASLSVCRVAVDQNFVPVVDSRGVLMGIVTRKTILEHLWPPPS